MKTNQPYSAGPLRALKGIRKRFGFGTTDDVRHRCTCPVCGAKLVNLYHVGNKWRCSKCKEK